MVSIILRQLDLSTASETERALFNIAYPGFAKGAEGRGTLTLIPPPPAPPGSKSRLFMLKKADASVLYEQTKPRRFAGGNDLGSQRYYAVVGSKEASSDDGTLVSEIQEYWDPNRIFNTGSVLLFDGSMAADRELLAEYGIEWDHDPSTMICAFFPLHMRHITAAAEFLGRTQPTTVVLPLRTKPFEVASEGILDLRCLEGQREFLELVRSDEFLRSKCTDPNDPNLFLYCIPAIIAEQRGGTYFHAYVGHALRRRGVRGLIYPSARRDASTEVVDGNLTQWTGWCFIDYQGAPKLNARAFENFPEYQEVLLRPGVLSDAARIDSYSNPVYAGSFSITGIENDRWGLISTIKRNAKKRAEEIFATTVGPRAFSLEESELLLRPLKDVISKEWQKLSAASRARGD